MAMLEGSFLKNKWGPLPAWAWMAMGLGVALVISVWQKNKAAAQEQPESTEDSTEYTLPENLAPTYAFVDADTTLVNNTVTYPSRPPGGGRPGPPVVKPPTTPPPTKPVTPLPGIKPKPAPQPPKGVSVTVVPWKDNRKKGTPDSIWGIAEKVFGTSKVTKGITDKIWNAPQNATLRKKRGKPDQIRPGDKVWVPL